MSSNKDNIPYFKYIKIFPVDEVTKTKSSEEILNRVIIDYTLASCATYAFCSAYNLIKPALNAIDERFNINTILSNEDRDTILNIVNMKYGFDELESFSYRFERCNVYLWVLGFLDIPDPRKKCSIKKINEVLLNANSYSDLLKNVNMRSYEEMSSYLSSLNKYFVDEKNYNQNDETLIYINKNILDMQKSALEFVTTIDEESTIDSYKVEVSKHDLNFEFILPSTLEFDVFKKASNELLALKSKEGTSKMMLQDLGPCKIDDYEENVNKHVTMFEKNGFKIVNALLFSSENLTKKIKHVVVEKGKLMLNSYFILISNHLLRLDSLIDNHTNPNDYNDNINSKNTSNDLDVIFSIKNF